MKIKAYFIFFRYILKEGKAYLFLKIFWSIFEGFVPAIAAIIPKYIIDSLVAKDIDISIKFIIVYIVVIAIIMLISTFYAPIISFLEDKIKSNITKDTIKNIYKMNYQLYDTPENYDIINRAFNYATTNGTTLLNDTFSLVSTFITLTTFLYILTRHSSIVIVAIIIFIIVQTILLKAMKKTNYNYNRDIAFTNRGIEYFRSLLLKKEISKEVKINDAIDKITSRYDIKKILYRKKTIKKDTKTTILSNLLEVSVHILIAVVMLSLGLKVINGIMTLGDYTVVLSISQQFSYSVFGIIKLLSSFYGNFLESQNYVKFLDLVEEENGEINPFIENDMVTIEFKNINFKYPNQENYVFENFNLKIESGKSLTILGDNGSGKSTLIKLILRLYRVEQGEILINGVNINNINIYEYYKKTEVVFQDFELISGLKIYENISLFDENKIEKLMKSFEIPMEKYDLNKSYSKLFNDDG